MIYITYTVKAGDTLYGISNQFGVSVTELARLNNVTAESLKVGQVLKIPTTSGTNPNTMFMYTVKLGDTLYKIATKYNTTVAAIKDLNNLTSNNLSIGTILRIPEMYTPEDQMSLPNYTSYTVKKGDTIYTIARNNNISVDTLIKDNSLASNTLSVGQVLKIRTTDNMTEEVLECFGPDYTPQEDTSTTTYIVKKGDNLYDIAKKYNTSVSVIKSLNNLTSDSLSIGQNLKIPSNTTNNSNNNSQTYTVKKGDSLYSIASKYNTTVSELKSLNNLTSNNLSIGKVLKIPSKSSSSTTYTVKSGDNLYSIANKFNTTVNSIKTKNNLTSNLLSIGQVLII